MPTDCNCCCLVWKPCCAAGSETVQPGPMRHPLLPAQVHEPGLSRRRVWRSYAALWCAQPSTPAGPASNREEKRMMTAISLSARNAVPRWRVAIRAVSKFCDYLCAHSCRGREAESGGPLPPSDGYPHCKHDTERPSPSLGVKERQAGESSTPTADQSCAPSGSYNGQESRVLQGSTASRAAGTSDALQELRSSSNPMCSVM